MKDLIFYIIIGGLFAINVFTFYKTRKNENFVYRIVFLSRSFDWFLAMLLIVIIITIGSLIEPIVPNFLKWNIFSLLEKDGTNANIEIINQISKKSLILCSFVFAFLILLLPKTAYWEEKQFRHNRTKIKETFLVNIKFGLSHCIVGIPIWVGLLLSVAGFALSLKYIFTWRKTNILENALESSTSLHGKYNIIIITILLFSLLLK